MEYKYTLIISQYYYSRHMFICKLNTDFIENAKRFSYELMKYKRYESNIKELIAGDLDYVKDDKIRRRYNVNDSGDIYFIQSDSINELMFEFKRYQEDSFRESNRERSQRVYDEISKHHQYGRVRELVQKYFEIL